MKKGGAASRPNPTSTDSPVRPSQANTVDKVDRDRADRLKAYARHKGWAVSTDSQKWGSAFARLRESRPDFASQSEIDLVLDWYIATDPKKPELRNGEQFFARWDWIKSEYDRDPGKAVVVTDEAAKIVKRLDNYRLPQPDGWPVVVQRSLDNFREAKAKVQRAADAALAEGDGRNGVTGPAAYLLRNHFHPDTVGEQLEDMAQWACQLNGSFQGDVRDVVPRLLYGKWVAALRADLNRRGHYESEYDGLLQGLETSR
jgi:hypothetical protein